MNYKLLYESFEYSFILMIEGILKNENIICIVHTGNLSGVHGGLGGVNPSRIYVRDCDFLHGEQVLNIILENERR